MSRQQIGFVVFVAVLIYQCSTVDAAAVDRYRLTKHLLSNYQSVGGDLAIPGDNGPLNVGYGISLIRSRLDVYRNYLQADTYLTMTWTDKLLAWNPPDFAGIQSIRMPVKYLWKPDIVMYNRMEKPELDEDLNAVIYNDGTVLWMTPVKLNVPCDPNPSDKHTYSCSIKVGSWTYDGFLLDINFYNDLEAVDLSFYTANPHHPVVSNKAVKNTKYYPCCEEPYPNLTFNLTFSVTSRRRDFSDIL